MTGQWRFWIDRGGTFTDVVALSPRGELLTRKYLSENPEQYKDAAIHGMRRILGLADGESIPANTIAEVRMGTTVATNAILEKRGEPTLLLTTRGFADAFEIGDQRRPQIFKLKIEKKDLLYHSVAEVDERIDAEGRITEPMNEPGLEASLHRAYADGLRSIAIVFMNSYANSVHEQRAAKIAADTGFSQISVSSEIVQKIRFLHRGGTALVDAYLSPVLRRYVDQVTAELGDVNLGFMQSSGGLADAKHFQGKDAILSGPAGGVVGAVRTATAAGYARVIGFDMGGTSTDVCHYDGEFERREVSDIAGTPISVPMLKIHTVAAGGGSIIHFDGTRLRVGPESAGAIPGPAAYRRGGPLTVTDCNVLLGKINAHHFPKVFGKHATEPLDADVVTKKFKLLAESVNAAMNSDFDSEALAQGCIDIAVQNMAEAIRKISVEQGYDVSKYVLTCFGGAGGQHACLVADALGMKQVYLHPLAGVLSAFGIGQTQLSEITELGLDREFNADAIKDIERHFSDLERAGMKKLLEAGADENNFCSISSVRLRFQGSDSSMAIAYTGLDGTLKEFEQRYIQRFGFIETGAIVIVDSLVVESTAGTFRIPKYRYPESGVENSLHSVSKIYSHNADRSGQGFHETPIRNRRSLKPGDAQTGPVMLLDDNSTIIVEPGWQVTADDDFGLHLERVTPVLAPVVAADKADPVLLEIFNRKFMSIAEHMGSVLERTAYSVNIKERLDFSCALFDATGGLIANAPHVPVHLGSMGQAVRYLLTQHEHNFQPGDAYMLNDPFHGGTHLPDVTVVSPVYLEDSTKPEFFVASRGHHADIGGTTPGSMPARSVRIDQEGILFRDFHLLADGKFNEVDLRKVLASSDYPARNPGQNVSDLKAQVAANVAAIEKLRSLVREYSLPVVRAYTNFVQQNAEEAVRKAIGVLHDGSFELEMDNGAAIRVCIRIDHATESAEIDFTGTSSQTGDNFNAPSAICRACVLYVFRCLVDDDIPLNEGCMKPLNVIIPEGSLLNPDHPAAVVAGNVETSQCVVDALLGALGIEAASQGTMNNFTFGNENWQYYETLGGGSGAGDGFDGADAVQCHMTNSRLTDPEVLEHRFPVQIRQFSVRRGSGGQGANVGGNGLVRCIRFLTPMTAAIVSNRRRTVPFGLAGGGNARSGINRVLRVDGTTFELGFSEEVQLQAGDEFIIETPGGGGYGE